MAGTYLLPDAVGPAHARDLLLTGRIVDADEALRLGLVSRVLEEDGSSTRCSLTAREIAATAPIASRLTKLALADGGHADFESGLQWEAMAQPLTLATEDLQEGIRAAREKRTPAFTGGDRPEHRRGPGSSSSTLAFPLRVSTRIRPGPRLPPR